MGFSEETIASVRGDSLPEIGVLLAASAPAGSAPLPGGAGRAPNPDPDRLFELARLNKMLGVLPLAPVAATDRFAEASEDTVTAILTEAGRLSTEVLAEVDRIRWLHRDPAQ